MISHSNLFWKLDKIVVSFKIGYFRSRFITYHLIHGYLSSFMWVIISCDSKFKSFCAEQFMDRVINIFSLCLFFCYYGFPAGFCITTQISRFCPFAKFYQLVAIFSSIRPSNDVKLMVKYRFLTLGQSFKKL